MTAPDYIFPFPYVTPLLPGGRLSIKFIQTNMNKVKQLTMWKPAKLAATWENIYISIKQSCGSVNVYINIQTRTKLKSPNNGVIII